MTKRDYSIDIAKAIGIIAVVLGHTNFPYSQIIYQFHMPLFFFLSGTVFSIKKTKDIKHFILSKVKGLYLPFIKFELIFLAFHNVFTYIGLYSDLSNIQVSYSAKTTGIMILKILSMGGGEQLAGPLWFLISSFEIVILFTLASTIAQKMCKYPDLVLFLGCLALFYVGCFTNLPRMLSQALIGMLFFFFGYCFKKYEERISITRSAAIVSAAIVIVSSLFNYVDISQLDITHKWMLILSGLAGAYFVLYISRTLVSRNKTFLLYCGKNTLYILALHCISFKVVMIFEIILHNSSWDNLGLFPTYQINAWWSIPLTIVGVILPLVVKRIIDQCKLSRRD